MNWYIQSKDVLIHAGIKGQKWGVRRFQNEDGTLTAAGKERYKNMMPTKASSAFQKSKERTRNPQRMSGNIEYNRLLSDHGYDEQADPANSYLTENALADEQAKFEEWCSGKSREAMTEEIDRKYAFDSEEYGKDIADKLRKIRSDVVRKYDSDKNQKEKINRRAKIAQSRLNAAQNALPTSARRAQNEAIMKSRIPASAWVARSRSLGKG